MDEGRIEKRRQSHRLRVFLSLLPGIPFLVAELFFGSSIPRDLGLVIVSPLGEETVKLLAAFGIMSLWRQPQPQKAHLGLPFSILLSPLIVGMSFALIEHFYRYGSEGLDVLLGRLLTHVLFVTMSVG